MTRPKPKMRTRSGSDMKHDRAGLKGIRMKTKKGGAGGSFTWGKPGDEANLAEIGKGDPNYDSEDNEIENYLFTVEEEPSGDQDYSYLNGRSKELTAPKYSVKEFKVEALKVIREYYLEGDAAEFIQCVSELNSEALHDELVKKLIVTSLEKTDRERELCSVILVELQRADLLLASQTAKAFEAMFESLDDLQLDVPNVKRLLVHFVARCVVDDVLPPAFLMNSYIESIAAPIVLQAKVQLSIKHNYGRIEKVWGPNKNSSLDELKHEIKMILLEYLSSADCTEVATLIKNLKIPFFHHEVIKRGVIISLEHKEREQAMISVLFKELVVNAVISKQQCALGFQRLYQEIKDLKLDYPNADQILDIFAKQAVMDDCLSTEDLASIKEKATKLREDAEKERKEQDGGDE